MKTLVYTMGLFVVLTAIGFATSAQTANYELGVPSSMSCTGVLRANKYPGGVRYNLEPIKGYPNRNQKEDWEGYNDMLCSATLADTSPSVDSPLGKETIKRLLRECSTGKICDVTGQVNGMSHDIFFWVVIYTINPTIRKPEGADSLLTEEQARDKAVQLLVGWQWGHTKAQALQHIKRVDFLAHGYVEPGEGGSQCNNPTWKFTIAKDRYLYIDATTGEDCIVIGLIPD